jgi:putative N-acetylmannosamine-6-phosphate epimerase
MKYLNTTFLLFITLLACNDNAKMREVYIQEQIKLGIEKRIAEKRMECITAVMDSASRLADSIVTAKMTAMDTSMLRRPQRPTKPIIKSSLDTTPVQPILPK